MSPSAAGSGEGAAAPTVATVLVFEGQGARIIPGESPVELADLTPAAAQAAIVAYQLDRAAALTAAHGGSGLAVIGQSLGELSALVVAGALDRDEARDLVRLRAELPARLLPERRWTMASITRVKVDRAREAAEGLELWVIGENGPADVIVVGTADDFEHYAERLRLTPTTYRELPVVHPYHTPVMQPVADALGEALSDMTVRAPAVPVLSPTGPRSVTDADDVRAVVVDALVSPVAWSAALTTAASRWPDARWRECGPSASLHRFVWKNHLDLDWADA